MLSVLFAARDVERDQTLNVLKSLYMDGVPNNIYQWRHDDSVVTQVVSLLHRLT